MRSLAVVSIGLMKTRWFDENAMVAPHTASLLVEDRQVGRAYFLFSSW
jgi:hypothetical protein